MDDDTVTRPSDDTVTRSSDEAFTRPSADLTHNCPTCGLAVSATQRTCPVDGTPIAQHLPGYILDGKYEFIELIGSGGMGVIYRARQIILNRPVAVKMMHSHMLSDKALMRFQREGKAGSALSHQNITAVLDFAISQHGQPYMVMEFEVGQTLAQMIEVRGALAPEFVLDAIIQICQGLSHAHERNVLHRDLKPSNLMVVQRTGEPPLIKILDFGIAKILETGDDKAKTITRTGETMGSPPYMSPEQAVSSNIDQRSDLYSLGCVMFECLAGTPPFMAENTFSIMMAHANDEPPTLREASLGNQYPGELERIVKKLLAKKSEDRYQSAKELERDLQRYRTGQIGSDSNAKRDKPKLVAITTMALIGFIIAGAAWCLPGILSKFGIRNSIIDSTKSPATNAIANLPQTTTAKTVDTESSTKVANDTSSTMTQNEAMDAALDEALDNGKKNIQKYLKENPDTRIIKLGSNSISDSDLSGIAKYADCQRLELQGNKLVGSGLTHLSAMKDLNTLILSRNDIHGDMLKPLSELTSLRDLDLGYNANFTGEDFSHFGKKNKLDALNLQRTLISDAGLKALERIGKILNLSLAGTSISENGIKSICAISGLGCLDLTKTNLTKSKLSYLCSHMPTLPILFIGDTDIGDDSLPDLMKLRNLVYLDVSATHISPKGILRLGGLPVLTKLYCGGCGAFEAVGRLHATRPNLSATEAVRGREAELPVGSEAKSPSGSEAKSPSGSEAKSPVAPEAKSPSGSEAKSPVAAPGNNRLSN